jgi:alpha-tubulin suppressor-like RCC1 family protein
MKTLFKSIFGLVAALTGLLSLINVQSAKANTLRGEALAASTPPLLSNIQAIDAGGSHTCALTDGGDLKCWGANFSGEIGDGTTYNRFAPMNVLGLSSGIIAISSGSEFSCAVTSEGQVKCWGKNEHGQLGDGTTVNRRTPVDVAGLSDDVTAITTGHFHACALTVNHKVQCWGKNDEGQLGDGTTTSHDSPVEVVGIAEDVIAVDAGKLHTCAVTSDGGVKCWGYNIYGQLGDQTTAQRLTPTDVFGLTSGVLSVSAGGYHTCALTTAGGVKCWGLNHNGELGNGQNTNSSIPVNVSGMAGGMVSVQTGHEHTCAVSASGKSKCWGLNQNGQLGDGTLVDRNRPVAVVGLSSGVQELSTGYSHSCALLSAGNVKCWGYNDFGQLGDGSAIERLTPVNVLDLKVAIFRSNPTLDGTILETAENSNVGGTVNSSGSSLFVGDDNSDRQYRSIVSFNTSILPDTAIIHNATFGLFWAGAVGTDPYWSLRVFDIRRGVFGASASLQADDFQAPASLSAIGPLFINETYSDGLLSDAAFPYFNLTGNTQFRVRYEEDDNDNKSADYVMLYSGEAQTQYRPLLTVYYFVP